MGIFHEQVEVVNRTSKVLAVRFDGQDMEIEPNYDEQGNRLEGVVNFIPKVAMSYARAQNPIMGSESVTDPSAFDCLLGFIPKKGEKFHPSYMVTDFFDVTADALEKGTDALTRVPLSEVLEDDPQVKDVKVRGRRTDVDTPVNIDPAFRRE
jgi:hypothetical protein